MNESYKNLIFFYSFILHYIFFYNLFYPPQDLLLSMVVDNANFNDVGLEFKYVPFIESVLYDNILSDAERLEYLKKYFTEIDNADYKLLLECVAVIKDSNDDNSVLLDFENWIKSQ